VLLFPLRSTADPQDVGRNEEIMIQPEMKSVLCHNLEYGMEPPDSEDCSLFIEVQIGPKGQKGADIFSFEAVTPKSLIGKTERRWGRGLLILDTFSWSGVEKALEKLLMHCARQTWEETAKEIAKELDWEFDNYKA
jgi:hypothetical protein